MKKLLVSITAVLALAACSSDPGEPDLLAPQRQALERAEDVERVMQEAAERRQSLIEEQEP